MTPHIKPDPRPGRWSVIPDFTVTLTVQSVTSPSLRHIQIPPLTELPTTQHTGVGAQKPSHACTDSHRQAHEHALIQTHTDMQTHPHTQIHTYTHVHICPHIQTHTYTQTHRLKCPHIHTCAHMPSHILIHMRTCTHIHADTHIHIYACAHMSSHPHTSLHTCRLTCPHIHVDSHTCAHTLTYTHTYMHVYTPSHTCTHPSRRADHMAWPGRPPRSPEETAQAGGATPSGETRASAQLCPSNPMNHPLPMSGRSPGSVV